MTLRSEQIVLIEEVLRRYRLGRVTAPAAIAAIKLIVKDEE